MRSRVPATSCVLLLDGCSPSLSDLGVRLEPIFRARNLGALLLEAESGVFATVQENSPESTAICAITLESEPSDSTLSRSAVAGRKKVSLGPAFVARWTRIFNGPSCPAPMDAHFPWHDGLALSKVARARRQSPAQRSRIARPPTVGWLPGSKSLASFRMWVCRLRCHGNVVSPPGRLNGATHRYGAVQARSWACNRGSLEVVPRGSTRPWRSVIVSTSGQASLIFFNSGVRESTAAEIINSALPKFILGRIDPEHLLGRATFQESRSGARFSLPCFCGRTSHVAARNQGPSAERYEGFDFGCSCPRSILSGQ